MTLDIWLEIRLRIRPFLAKPKAKTETSTCTNANNLRLSQFRKHLKSV